MGVGGAVHFGAFRAACVLGAAFATADAAEPAPPAPLSAGLAEAIGGLGESITGLSELDGDWTTLSAPSPALIGGKPAGAMLVQEGKAAALWTGRAFHARGKIDGRASDERIERASVETPAGWSREKDTLVHHASGLLCPMSLDVAGDGNDRELTLGGVTRYDEKNLDVSCNYSIAGDATIALHASYFPDISVEDHAAGAVAAILQNYAVKGTLPVLYIEMERTRADGVREKLPEPIAGAWDVGEVNGVAYKTAIWLVKAKGWHLKARGTYAQTDAGSEAMAAVLFALNHVVLDSNAESDPAGAGPEV